MLEAQELKQLLDEYVLKYETEDFIKNDPVMFVHKYSSKQDIETAGFIASVFAYGRREAFIEKLNYIFEIMENKPFDYVKSGDFSGIKNCSYRFSKDIDLVQLLKILNTLFSEGETLGSLFEYSYKEGGSIWQMFQGAADYFYARVNLPVTDGFYHLIPNPGKKSALKRMNMMLRWFVRKSAVDIGIWDFVPISELLLPLDTHSARISRQLGILKRSDNGYESVMEVSAALRQFDAADPAKYDFALFGFGVNNASEKIGITKACSR